MQNLIQPVEVQRDKAGFWYHPDIPDFDEGQETEYRAWLAEQRLDTRSLSLEYENDTHPAYVKYFEVGDPDCSEWNPALLDGEGWWLLAIGDTEDGPVATWARRLDNLPNEARAQPIAPDKAQRQDHHSDLKAPNA